MDYQTTTVPYLPLFEILAAAQADDTDTHGAEGEQQAAGDAVAEEQGADSEEQGADSEEQGADAIGTVHLLIETYADCDTQSDEDGSV